MNDRYQRFICLGWRKDSFGFSAGFAQVFLDFDQRLKPLVSKKYGVEHLLFTDNIAAAFHHDHTGFGAGNDNIDVSFDALGDGGIDLEFSLNSTYADTCDGACKRDI